MNKPVVCALVGIFAIILFSNSTVSASWSVEAGFEAVLAGLLFSLDYIMRRGRIDG